MVKLYYVELTNDLTGSHTIEARSDKEAVTQAKEKFGDRLDFVYRFKDDHRITVFKDGINFSELD